METKNRTSTLIKVWREGYAVFLQTYDRKRGRSPVFRAHAAPLTRAWDNETPTTIRSGNNFLTIQRVGDELECSIVWLSGSDSCLHGYEQHFMLLAYDMENALDGTESSLRVLYRQ